MMGDPVPGAELFLEVEPDDEPIAHGTTDATGMCRLPLVVGELRVKLLMPQAASLAISAAAVRIHHEQTYIASKALAVPFNREGPAPLAFSISSDQRREAAVFQVMVLDPRSPLEQALLTGLSQYRLQSAPCFPLLDAFFMGLSAALGAPSVISDEDENTQWPPSISVQKSAMYLIETTAGSLQVTVGAVVRINQGQPKLEAGGMFASTTEEATALAMRIHQSILRSLAELRGAVKGVDIVLFVPPVPTKATGSKGGFAVGGFSQV